MTGDILKLSTKGRYGLRAMIDLARFSENEAVSIASIAGRQHISEGYLEQIIAILKKDGLVRSRRGAGGGYQLAKDAKEISVGDILRSLEGSLEPVVCHGLQEDSDGCEGADTCVTKFVWKRINDSIRDAVDTLTLDELAENSRKAEVKAGSYVPNESCSCE